MSIYYDEGYKLILRGLRMQEISSYDIVPYQNRAVPETHPDRMATVATLFGIKPPAPHQSKILELGCANGSNLIPLAMALPQSSLTGIDLSSRQVEEANAKIKKLGLNNVKILKKNILELSADLGAFDYIIVHGIFSWVAPDVQQKILEVLSTNLAQNGVAYLSYNTYPGWHTRKMVREMMLFHCRKYDDPQKYVQQARAFLEFIAATLRPSDSTHSKLLAAELEKIRHQPDWYLYHDYLEAVNEPVYFYQLAERASKVGLQYLGESNFTDMLIDKYPPYILGALKKLRGDIIQLEQTIDFLTNRMFRRSLFCRAELKFDRTVTPARLKELFVASALQAAVPAADFISDKEVEFRREKEGSIRARDPLIKTAFAILSEVWPRWLGVEELTLSALTRLRGKGVSKSEMKDAELENVSQIFLRCAIEKLVELHAYPAPFSGTLCDRPKTNALVREEARNAPSVTSLKLEEINLDEHLRFILPLLDGSRDIEKLREMFKKSNSSAAIVRPTAGATSKYANAADITVETLLEKARRAALLVQ